MPRKNRNARPRAKRKSVAHLFKHIAPAARLANAVYYTLGSALLPGTRQRGRGHFVRVFPVGPDTASRARKRKP